MSPDEWTRLHKLARQGAVHYQAEEEFMNAPLMKRSQSAPTSSLAERYERLRARACTSPGHFRRPDAIPTTPGLGPSLGPEHCDPADAAAMPTPSARMLDMMSFDHAPHETQSLPRSTSPPKLPTRILVRPAVGDDLDFQVESPAALVPTLPAVTHVFVPTYTARSNSSDNSGSSQGDTMMTGAPDVQTVPVVVPPEARARLSKKRGSDPDVFVPLPKKTKKKNRLKFFGRNRYAAEDTPDLAEAASASAAATRPRNSNSVSTSDGDRSDAADGLDGLDAPRRTWGQRVRSYVRHIFGKR